jgi:ribosomal protein S18 acetylase RimI-like enzyme
MVTIRKADVSDIENLSELFDQYRIFYNQKSDLEGARIFLKERINRSESIIFVAGQRQTLCGFVQMYPIFSSTRMRGLWLLNDLYVHHPYRRLGIAKQLLETAADYARESKYCGLILETAKTNIEANQLYIKSGWQLDTDHNYYYFDV